MKYKSYSLDFKFKDKDKKIHAKNIMRELRHMTGKDQPDNIYDAIIFYYEKIKGEKHGKTKNNPLA